MKLSIDKLNRNNFTVEGLNLETEEKENGFGKGWIILAIFITLTVVFTVCITLKLTVDYTLTNKPSSSEREIKQPQKIEK